MADKNLTDYSNRDMESVNPDEAKLVEFIKKRYEQAKRWKFYYAGSDHKKWVELVKWYKGYHYEVMQGQKSKVVINKAFGIVQQELPFMTDNPPKVYLQPQEPSDERAAKIFKSLIETSFVNRGMQKKLPECVLYAKQMGTSFWMPFWNPKLANGLGDVDVAAVSPFNIFPFAYSESLDVADGIIHAEHVSLGFLKRMWPDKAGIIQGGSPDPSLPDVCRDTNFSTAMGDTGYAQVTDTEGSRTDYLPSAGGGEYDPEKNYKRILLLRTFFKDDSLEEYEEEQPQDDGTSIPVTKSRPKFPNGRVVIVSGGIVLEDKPYEYEFFPYISMVNYFNPGEFWGIGDIEQVKSENMQINKLSSLLVDSFRRSVYSIKTILSQSGIDVDNFVITDDAVYEANVANPIQEATPQGPNTNIINYLEVLKTDMDKVSGTSEYSAPQSGDLPSGEAFKQYKEISETRLRQKIQNMEDSIRLLGKAWLEMMLKNYTEARVMRVINPQNKQADFIYVFNEPNPGIAQQELQRVMTQTQPGSEQKDPNTGQPIAGTGIPIYKDFINLAEIKGEMDLTVATGSTVSTSKLAEFDRSMMLFQAGVIDAQALLEAADYPNKDEIMKRMAAAAQQQAQMQQQQAQAQQQPAPASPQQPPVPPKVSLSLKGEDLLHPVAQAAVMAGIQSKGGNVNG